MSLSTGNATSTGFEPTLTEHCFATHRLTLLTLRQAEPLQTWTELCLCCVTRCYVWFVWCQPHQGCCACSAPPVVSLLVSFQRVVCRLVGGSSMWCCVARVGCRLRCVLHCEPPLATLMSARSTPLHSLYCRSDIANLFPVVIHVSACVFLCQSANSSYDIQ